jgi:hypothetical protein
MPSCSLGPPILVDSGQLPRAGMCFFLPGGLLLAQGAGAAVVNWRILEQSQLNDRVHTPQ